MPTRHIVTAALGTLLATAPVFAQSSFGPNPPTGYPQDGSAQQYQQYAPQQQAPQYQQPQYQQQPAYPEAQGYPQQGYDPNAQAYPQQGYTQAPPVAGSTVEVAPYAYGSPYVAYGYPYVYGRPYAYYPYAYGPSISLGFGFGHPGYYRGYPYRGYVGGFRGGYGRGGFRGRR